MMNWSLIFTVTKCTLLKPIIKETMENAYKMSIPLTVDLGEGNNWLEAH